MAVRAATFIGAAGTAGNDHNGQTVSVDLSAISWADGDLLVVHYGANGGTDLAPSGTALTLLGSESTEGETYYRYLEAGDPDTYNFTVTGSVFWGLGWSVWRGTDGLAPSVETATSVPSGNTTINPSTSKQAPTFLTHWKRSRGVSYNVSSPGAKAWENVVGVNVANDNNGTHMGAYGTASFVVDTTAFSRYSILAIGGEDVQDPDPDSGWWIEVWDLDNQNKLMDDWVPAVNCVFERVFNDIGSGSLTVPASWSRIGELCDPPNDVTTLLKVYIDDYFRYAFRADQVEKTYQEDGNAVVRIFGPGYEAIVDDGDIPAADYPDNPSVAPDWVYGYTEIYTQGFESDSLDGWTGFNFEGSGGTNGELSTDTARGGTASVKFTTGGTDLSPDRIAFYKAFTTEPGRQYRFMAYAQGTGDYYLFARDLEADGAADFSAESEIGVGGTVTGTGGTAWDQVTYTFTAPSATTRMAVVTDTLNHTFYVDDITVEEGDAEASIGAIVNDLLVATQAQSNATALTDDFSDSTDSAGSAWVPSSLAMTVSDGPPFGTILDRAAGLGYEWEVKSISFDTGGDLGYRLSLYNPGNLGTDYTGLTSAPTIRQGSIIYGGTSRQHVAKNVVRVVTAGGYWAEATDAASTAAIGRRVETIQNAAVEGTAIAQELADARLAVHQDQAQAMWVQLSERSDVRPFLDFQVGDTIKVEMDETFGVSGWFRVREIRADLTGEGNEIQYAVDLRP